MWKFRQIAISPDGKLYALDAEGQIRYIESQNPERSPRSRQEVETLLSRIVFEITMRGAEVKHLEAQFEKK